MRARSKIRAFNSLDPLSWYEQELFATMQAGPRISADDVAPSYGLFSTCRGENIYE
jgi:hypothetical protein